MTKFLKDNMLKKTDYPIRMSAFYCLLMVETSLIHVLPDDLIASIFAMVAADPELCIYRLFPLIVARISGINNGVHVIPSYSVLFLGGAYAIIKTFEVEGSDGHPETFWNPSKSYPALLTKRLSILSCVPPAWRCET